MFWTKVAYIGGSLVIGFGLLLIIIGWFSEPELVIQSFGKEPGRIVDNGLSNIAWALPVVVLAEIGMRIVEIIRKNED